MYTIYINKYAPFTNLNVAQFDLFSNPQLSYEEFSMSLQF